MFPAATYQNRRQQLAQQLSSGLILIMGNDDAPMNYGANPYPFCQDSNFRYYAGIKQAGLSLTIDPATGESTLYGDDLTLADVVWMGEHPSTRELADRVGIEHTASRASLAEVLKKNSGPLHFLPPYRAARQQFLAATVGSTTASVDLIQAVVTQRSVKTAEEIAEMEIAVNTSRRMHHAAMEMARPGMLEAEVAGAIEGIAISGGGRLAYPAIVTRNGHILHNHDHSNPLQAGDLLLIDAGASSPSGYAGDITRTFCIGRAMNQQQEEIYRIVKKAEEDVIRDLKAGVPYQDYHRQASLIIAEGLTELGLMQGDPAEAVAAGAHAMFFPHGLGHMIGLDVHDMEDLGEDYVGYDAQTQRSDQFGTAYLRLGRALEPGFVLTVEPGIYFIPALIDQWRNEGKFTDFINYAALAAYRDFGGIRIEDNVLITDSGSRVLGEPIKK
ncbi:MAG: aminopeptidase P family protein [Bacteroidota bacterium]